MDVPRVVPGARLNSARALAWEVLPRACSGYARLRRGQHNTQRAVRSQAIVQVPEDSPGDGDRPLNSPATDSHEFGGGAAESARSNIA